MYGTEVILAAVICLVLSAVIFLLARKSFSHTDVIVSNSDLKLRNKTTKRSTKIKTAKKETGKVKEVKNEDEEMLISPENVKKNKRAKVETRVDDVTVVIDKVAIDTSSDWQSVSKIPKKINKKDMIHEESVLVETDASNITSAVEPSVVIETTIKSRKSNKRDSTKAIPQKIEEIKADVKPKQSQNKEIVEEIKLETVSEEIDLRRRIGELMSELDKQKSLNKEENKTNLQTNNQLNKDFEALKQKMKVSQATEERLTEELKKRNTSFNDFKQQYMIVQSELTKNIVQVQSISREKDKLENRVKMLDENNKQLSQKNELFDEVNAERENLEQRVSAIDGEYKSAMARFNELLHGKDAEASERINQLQHEKQRLQDQLVHVQTDLIENSSRLQSMQHELLKTSNTYTDLLNENMHMQASCVALENTNTLLKQQQLSDVSTRDQETSERIRQVLQESEDLKAVNAGLMEERVVLLKQCHQSQSHHSSEEALNETISTLTKELDDARFALSQTKNESENNEETYHKLVSEISELKTDKENLVALVEEYKVNLSNTESSIVTLQNVLSEEEVKWRECVLTSESGAQQKIECLEQKLVESNDALSHTQKDSADLEKMVSDMNELRRDKENLISLVEKYKSGLENTETILSKLQISVNEEESKWRESLLKSESEAEKCSTELETVYKDLMRIKSLRADKNELNFAYHCVDKSLSSLIDEMEARMNHFEASLETVIQERDNALAQIHMQMNGSASQDCQQSVTVNGDSNDCDMSRIKEDLCSQVELNKALELHCNKYRSLIEIGKDALEAEQVQVRGLKEELKLLQCQLLVEVNGES